MWTGGGGGVHLLRLRGGGGGSVILWGVGVYGALGGGIGEGGGHQVTRCQGRLEEAQAQLPHLRRQVVGGGGVVICVSWGQGEV
jgi:hypothetical protein